MDKILALIYIVVYWSLLVIVLRSPFSIIISVTDKSNRFFSYGVSLLVFRHRAVYMLVVYEWNWPFFCAQSIFLVYSPIDSCTNIVVF